MGRKSRGFRPFPLPGPREAPRSHSLGPPSEARSLVPLNSVSISLFSAQALFRPPIPTGRP